jgi:signal transduction histidine kinase
LINLIGNAIKFTKSGAVDITSQGLARPGEAWCLQFSVRDTGMGIPESARDKLFLSFSQVDTSTTTITPTALWSPVFSKNWATSPTSP